MPNQKLKLQCSDENILDVDLEMMTEASSVIKSMCENTGDADEGEEEAPLVPLSNVDSVTMKKIIEWATHHKDDPTPSDEEKIANAKSISIQKWDAEFLDMEWNMLRDLIAAANFLDIQALLDLTCQRVANMMEGKDAAALREEFEVECDFTEEEIANIKKENDYVVDEEK